MKKIVLYIVICLLGYLSFYFYNNNTEEVNDYLQSTTNTVFELIEDLNNNKNYNEPLIPETLKPMVSIEDISYINEPVSVTDFKKVLLNMSNNNISELTLYYSQSYKKNFQDNTEIEENLSTAFDQIVVEYVDLFSSTNKLDFKMEGDMFSSTLALNLSATNTEDLDYIVNQMYFEKKCNDINDLLYNEGILNSNMSEYDIAKVLFKYITVTLEYDTELNKESFTGLGAIQNDMAVCQGYTAFYNYLLKLNGIDCFGQSGKILDSDALHIWTVATLDNNKTYIDVTFGDPVPNKVGYTDYRYFDCTSDFLSETRNGVE